MAEENARTRRRRARAASGPPASERTQPGAQGTHANEEAARPSSPSRASRRSDRPGENDRSGRSERALRDLTGAGPSRLSVSAALRARDLNRPTDDDLAAAERELVVRYARRQPEH